MQVVPPDTVTRPDIAVLLAATRVAVAVRVLVIVFAPETRRTATFQFSVTALPEIEPLIEFVSRVTSLFATDWKLPEIDEPV